MNRLPAFVLATAVAASACDPVLLAPCEVAHTGQEQLLRAAPPPGEATDLDWSVAFGPDNPRATVFTDDVVGVSVGRLDAWTVVPDPYLWETHGFMITAGDADPADAHDDLPIARVALDHDAAPDAIEALVAAKMAEYPEVAMTRSEVTVDGRTAVAVGPVPGGRVSTNVYLTANDRVYRINYFGESLDARGLALLATVRFHPPTRSVASLGLLDAQSTEALRGPQLGAPRKERPARASLSRGDVSEVAAAPEDEGAGVCGDAAEARVTSGEYALSNGCWAQPTTFFIQTTHSWDANGDGWSQMGTPNFWGENTHGNWGLGYCSDPYYTNDLYAIDYYLDEGDLLYSPFAAGYVTYAGWDPENWWNYGKMVVIQSPDGKYWSLSAHMSAVNVSAGDYVTDETVIGWAGSTGYADPYPHVHQAFYRYAYTSWGRPYGGQGLLQRSLSYLGNGGGKYSSFYKWKWVSW